MKKEELTALGINEETAAKVLEINGVVKMSDVNEYSCPSLKNEAGDALQCCVMYDHATITPNYIVAVFTDSVTADGAMEINPDISGSAHRTGRYSGIFEFTVSVEPRG